jgi:hypothetical protein
MLYTQPASSNNISVKRDEAVVGLLDRCRPLALMIFDLESLIFFNVNDTLYKNTAIHASSLWA